MRLLTPTLLAAAAALPTGATPVVLDDFSSDANFVAGRYTFYHVVNWANVPLADSVTVSDGTLKIDTIDINGSVRGYATAAQMWNAGEALRRVGDRVSVELTGIADRRTAGLFIDGDLAGRENGAELRWSGWDNDLVVSELMPDYGTTVRTTKAPPVTYEPVTDWASVEVFMEVRVAAVGPTGLDLIVDVTSDTLEPLSVGFTVPGSQAYFGPVAWNNRIDDPSSSYIRAEHDNLIFTPFVPEAGDLNGDGAITNGDISAFVMALTDRDGYATTYPGLDPDAIGDLTGDGVMTNGDIAGFVDLLTTVSSLTASADLDELTSLAAVPEPSSLALLSLGGLLFTRRRRAVSERASPFERLRHEMPARGFEPLTCALGKRCSIQLS